MKYFFITNNEGKVKIEKTYSFFQQSFSALKHLVLQLIICMFPMLQGGKSFRYHKSIVCLFFWFSSALSEINAMHTLHQAPHYVGVSSLERKTWYLPGCSH